MRARVDRALIANHDELCRDEVAALSDLDANRRHQLAALGASALFFGKLVAVDFTFEVLGKDGTTVTSLVFARLLFRRCFDLELSQLRQHLVRPEEAQLTGLDALGASAKTPLLEQRVLFAKNLVLALKALYAHSQRFDSSLCFFCKRHTTTIGRDPGFVSQYYR